MNTLSKNEVLKAMFNYKNGTFVRVAYKSDVPVKAQFKHEGYKVSKITETTARLGVQYGHIHTVVERRKLEEGKEKKERTNNYTWEIPNSMAFNSNTNKEYLTLANVPHGHNTKRKYVVEKPNGDVYTTDNLDSEKELIQDSYFNRKGNGNEIKYVSLENVVRIANYGTRVF